MDLPTVVMAWEQVGSLGDVFRWVWSGAVVTATLCWRGLVAAGMSLVVRLEEGG